MASTKYCGKDFLVQLGLAATAAWAITTAYTAGQVVTNSGNVYLCITAGTSAGSGGPTTTGTDIIDGTVHWRYVSANTAAAWVLSTAYAVGTLVANGGSIYLCITAGTSAASGGPSGTGSDILDNTVHWAFIATGVGFGFMNVAGARSTNLSLNNEQVDVTDKGDMPWRQLKDCGVRSMEMATSGMFTNDYSHDFVMARAINGSIIAFFRLVSGRADKFFGQFQMQIERTGEYNQAEQYSMAFASADKVYYVPAP